MNVKLDGLKVGLWRDLTKIELSELKAMIAGNK
jgi:16S rRNA U516 pseudouridylate synthase RsuA-like enzyme